MSRAHLCQWTIAVVLGVAVLPWSQAAGATHESPGDRNTARHFQHSIELIRAAQGALAHQEDFYASERHLHDAQDLLSPYDADDALRRARRVLERAIADLRNDRLTLVEKQQRLAIHAREAVRTIEGSETYRSAHVRSPGDRQPGGTMPAIASYTKAGYEPAALTIPIEQHTAGRSYSAVIVEVRKTDRFTVIIDSIFVRVNGEWQYHAIRHRTEEGRNEYAVGIPRGATELKLSLDHGSGSQLTVRLR